MMTDAQFLRQLADGYEADAREQRGYGSDILADACDRIASTLRRIATEIEAAQKVVEAARDVYHVCECGTGAALEEWLESYDRAIGGEA